MVYERVDKAFSKNPQQESDLNSAPRPVSFQTPQHSALSLEEHRRRHESISSDWRKNNNVLKSLRAKYAASLLETQAHSESQVDEKAAVSPSKESQQSHSQANTTQQQNSPQTKLSIGQPGDKYEQFTSSIAAPPESDLVQQTSLVQGSAAQMNQGIPRKSKLEVEALALTPKKLTNYQPRENFNKLRLITPPQLETLQPKQFSTNGTTQVNNKLNKGTQDQTQQALTPKQIAYTIPVSSFKELRPTPAPSTLEPKQFTSLTSKETQKVHQPQKLVFNVPGVDAAKKWVWDKLAEFGKLGQLLWSVFQKSWSVLVSIASNPSGFIDNLATALKQGLQNFLKNIVGYLQTGLVDWLTGGLGIQQEINLDSPQSIFNLALGLLGVNWSYIRQKAALKIGEGNVRKLEKSFQLFMTLKNLGLAGLWSQIKNTMGDLKKTVIDSIKNLLIKEVITKAVEQLVLTLVPGGAIAKLAQACYKILSFLIDKVTKIAEVVKIATAAVNKVASGDVKDAAISVELALVKSIPVLIGFFARLLGIDNLVARVKELLLKLKNKIDEIIDQLLNKAADWLSKLPKGTTTGKPKPPSNNNTTASPSNQSDHDNKVRVGLAQIDKEEKTYLNNSRIWKKDAQKVANKVKKDNPIFKSITVVDGGETWDYDWVASKGTKKGEKQAEKAPNDSGIIESENPPSLPDYEHVFHHGTIYQTAEDLNKEDIEAIGGDDFGRGFYVHTKKNWHKAKEWVKDKDEGWGVVSFPIPDDVWEKEVKQVDQLIFQFAQDHPNNMPKNTDPKKPFKDWADFVYHNKEFKDKKPPQNDLPTWKYKIIQGPIGRPFKAGVPQTTRDSKVHQVAFTETGVYILNLPEVKKLRKAVGKPNKHKKKKK